MASVVGLEEERFETEQCIEWTMGKIYGRRPYVSPTFTFQGRKSYLMLYLNYPDFFCTLPSSYKLYICGIQRLYLPFDVTIQVINGEFTNCWPRKTIKEQHEYLWMCSKSEMSDFIDPGNQEIECLRLRVILHTRSSRVNTENTSVQTPLCLISNPGLESLSRDIENLMVDPTLSPFDVRLKCGDHTFQAHRSVICAPSRVLVDMVKTGVEECGTSYLTVAAMNVSVFWSFLTYLYDGTTPDLTLDSAVQLYKVSQKYKVGGLVNLCSSFITDHMTADTACGFFALADDYNDSDLKANAICFILENKIFLFDDIWLPFCDSYSAAALEILNRHMKNNREK